MTRVDTPKNLIESQIDIGRLDVYDVWYAFIKGVIGYGSSLEPGWLVSGTIRRGPLSNNRKNRLDPVKTKAKRQTIG